MSPGEFDELGSAPAAPFEESGKVGVDLRCGVRRAVGDRLPQLVAHRVGRAGPVRAHCRQQPAALLPVVERHRVDRVQFAQPGHALRHEPASERTSTSR